MMSPLLRPALSAGAARGDASVTRAPVLCSVLELLGRQIRGERLLDGDAEEAALHLARV
jgi:hypothetical protein